MARRCELTGKGVLTGNNVSHAHNRTRRRFLPNVQETKLYSESLDRTMRFKVTAYALRSVEHNGGLDNFLLKAKDAQLSAGALRIKRELAKNAKAAAAA
ncbi:MAG: 50S ribosomal protein L28 [Alphaproteobacteria bacterium]|jgi:large subunit ribosomal protein L28|nr:50S ribosomal protein L28 [Alphaproteobacteria bacterium]MBT4082492.1 50S ribosomal protein L28 [Alphaproteobacteria bacterium]MBT4545664.1 50S ribosomal protein L28 [Alphaproteobacteria bacterium]MBT7745104.1 50S ribosomal protein L28 [Alphaproteobacteria bacterium]